MKSIILAGVAALALQGLSAGDAMAQRVPASSFCPKVHNNPPLPGEKEACLQCVALTGGSPSQCEPPPIHGGGGGNPDDGNGGDDLEIAGECACPVDAPETDLTSGNGEPMVYCGSGEPVRGCYNASTNLVEPKEGAGCLTLVLGPGDPDAAICFQCNDGGIRPQCQFPMR